MADLVLVSGKLEEQCKLRGLRIGGFHQNALCVQLFAQDLCCKFRSDQSNLQIALIAGVVGQHIVDHVIRIEVFVFTVGIQRQVYCTGQSLDGVVDRHLVLVIACDLRPVYVFQAKLDFVFFHSHKYTSLLLQLSDSHTSIS